jgi:hypothetical protein
MQVSIKVRLLYHNLKIDLHTLFLKILLLLGTF